MDQQCHHCGYELLGLPEYGQCPECGNTYDKHSTYRAVQAAQPVLAGHIKWISLATFTLLTLGTGAILAALSDRPWGVIALTLIIAGVSGFGAFTYWWSERQERRGAL